MIRKYFKDAGLLAITGGLLQLRGLVIIPLLTRRFGPVNYGVWSQVAVLISTLAPLIILGTDSAILRLLPGIDAEKQRRQFSAWVLFLLGMAVFIAAPLLLFKDFFAGLFFGETGAYAAFLSLAALWLITGAMTVAAQNWFRVRNNGRLYAFSTLLQAILGVCAVALMLVRGESAYELVAYSITADLALFLVCGLIILGEKSWARPDFSIIRPLVRFGLPLVPGGFAIWGLNYVDRVFIVQMLSLQEVGIYSLAYSIAYQVTPLLVRPWWAMFAGSAAELYNQKDTATMQALFERSAGLTVTLALPACAGLFLLGTRIFNLLATPEFSEGAHVLLFVSLGSVFLVLSSYYEVALGLIFKQYLSTWFYFLAFVLNVILNFVLIPKYSITGAALATMLAFLLILSLSMAYATKHKLLQTNFAFVGKIGIATVIMSLIVAFADRFVVSLLAAPIVELGALALLGAAVFAGLLWAMSVLTKKELKLALSLIRR